MIKVPGDFYVKFDLLTPERIEDDGLPRTLTGSNGPVNGPTAPVEEWGETHLVGFAQAIANAMKHLEDVGPFQWSMTKAPGVDRLTGRSTCEEAVTRPTIRFP